MKKDLVHATVNDGQVPAAPNATTAAPGGDAAPQQPPYSNRLKCTSCMNGSGPHGCTDCLNTGIDPSATAGGIEQMLNDAYAEGRKDEREEQEAFLRELLWGWAQRCCGNYEAVYGGEYMGEQEVVPACCGCPDVERNNDAEIIAVLRARIPDPELEAFDNGTSSDVGGA